MVLLTFGKLTEHRPPNVLRGPELATYAELFAAVGVEMMSKCRTL